MSVPDDLFHENARVGDTYLDGILDEGCPLDLCIAI